MIHSRMKSRLAIFLFYDSDGIVDDYIIYLLNDLLKNINKLVIVVNGKLTSDGKSKFESITQHIYKRENLGFDAGGWKDAMINYLGWEDIEKYDELILLNDSFYGPFYPFQDVFNEMDSRDIDFWGITGHGRLDWDIVECPYDYIPRHIQSYFIVFRNKIIRDKDFQRYWEKLQYFKTLNDTIYKHEVVITHFLEKINYTWDTFVNIDAIDKSIYSLQPISHCFFNTYELVKDFKCPILKRHSLGFDHHFHLDYTNGNHLHRTLDYINNYTKYDATLIYKNAIRLYNIADLFYNLHSIYVLPKYYSKTIQKYNAVLIIHIYYLDLVDKIINTINELCDVIDIIITTSSDEIINTLTLKLQNNSCDSIKFLKVDNKGRELSALLLTARKYISKYDYIAFCHDKRSHKGYAVTIGEDFRDLITENIFGSREYVMNILSLLDSHNEIGFLSPPPPHHSGYIGCLQDCWCLNFENTLKLAKRLSLRTHISSDRPALAVGSAFWCRREALQKLWDYPWSIDDFPSEPMPEDGTVSHALERIFPYVAQHHGYLTAWILTEDYASIEICNMYFTYRSNKTLLVENPLKKFIKLFTPKCMHRFLKKFYLILKNKNILRSNITL